MNSIDKTMVSPKQSFVLGLVAVILTGIGVVSLTIAPAFAASTSVNANGGESVESQQAVEDAKADAADATEEAKDNMNQAAEDAEERVEAAQEDVKNAEEDAAASTSTDAEVNTTSI